MKIRTHDLSSSVHLHKLAIVVLLILTTTLCCQAGLFDQIANGLKDVTHAPNARTGGKNSIDHTVIWNASPKQLFEMIGNPQVDLSDQGSAYNNLKQKASYISGAQATNSIEAAFYLAECYVSGKTGDGGPLYARNKNGFQSNRPEAYKLAIPFYESAAQYDHIPSLVRLSGIYADENYSGKDLNISLTNLFRAARLGDRNSFDSLWQLYSSGFPGVTDERLKFRGMELLADNGNPEAQIELSKWLISKDSKKAFDEAKGFLVPLADKGNASAIALLHEMESKVNAARAEAQQLAAAQKVAEEKKQAEEQASVAPKPDADKGLKYPQVEAQQPGTYTIIQKTPSVSSVNQEVDGNVGMVVVCLTLFAAWLTFAVIGISLGVKNRVVIFCGKRDVVVSFIICIFQFIWFIITMLVGCSYHTNGQEGMDYTLGSWFFGLGCVNILMLIYSARNSYLANNSSLKKTVVVVPAKLIISGLTVFAGFLTYAFARSAVESAAKASNTPGYTEELRKEKLQHQKNAVSSAAIAAFMGFVTYHLHKLIKKLIKDNPAPALKEPTE